MDLSRLPDLLGFLFLTFGILDGYRKGFVKKGMSLAATLVTLAGVYIVSPYVEAFIKGILPQPFKLERFIGTDGEIYRILLLSGLEKQAENVLYTLAARILAVIVTYAVIKIFVYTVFLSAEILTRVPGLSLLNRVVGALLGLIQQIFSLWIFFLVVMLFSETSWGSFFLLRIQQSLLLSHIYDNNLLVLAAILWILKI